MISSKINQLVETVLVDIPNALDEVGRIQNELGEKLEAIPLGDDPKKMIKIGVNLKPNLRERMIKFLRANADVFAWLASDMPDIPTDVIIYKLNIDPNFKSVQQKKKASSQKGKKSSMKKLISF